MENDVIVWLSFGVIKVELTSKLAKMHMISKLSLLTLCECLVVNTSDHVCLYILKFQIQFRCKDNMELNE